MSRVWLIGVVVGMVVLGGPGVAAPGVAEPGVAVPGAAAPAAKKIAAPTVAPARVIAGERVLVSGRLPGKGKRTVRVEQRRSGSWVRVAKTTSKMSGAFKVRFAVAQPGKVRVVAPRVKKLAAVTSRATPLGVDVQSGDLSGPEWAYRWRPAAYSLSFSPARPGRAVRLEQFVEDAWVVVDAGVQDAAGTAGFSLTPEELGAYRYRARTVKAKGAPAFATAEVPLDVRSEFGWTTRASSVCDGGEDGARNAAISRDGRYVAFECLPPGGVDRQVYFWDRDTGFTHAVTAGNGESRNATVSADGRYVAFESSATDLVPDDRNRGWDVLLWTRERGALERISRGAKGREPNGDSLIPSISDDGGRIAYVSGASNLGPVDTNGATDVYVWDSLGETLLASGAEVDEDEFGIEATHPAISGDGQYVAFESRAPGRDHLDVFLRDLEAGTTVQVSVGTDGDSRWPAVSGDGRYVVFESTASNLVDGDTPGSRDVFLWDRDTRSIRRVSNGSGTEGSRAASISGDGRFVVFQSDADDLLPEDNNGIDDIFVWDRVAGTTRRVSLSARGVQADGESYDPVISDAGRYVAYHSDATTLLDPAPAADPGPAGTAIYLWDRDS